MLPGKMNKLNLILTYLADHYTKAFPAEAVKALEQKNLSQVKAFVSQLEIQNIVLLLERFNPIIASECFQSLSEEKGLRALRELSPEKAAGILRLLPLSQTKLLLAHLPKKDSRILHTLILFPSETAGALMDPKVCSSLETNTVGEVKKMFKNFPNEDFNYLYTTDGDDVFQGRVLFLDFLKSEANTSLKDLQTPPHPSLPSNANYQEIVSHPGWREFPEIPVLDGEKRLLGVLHYQTLRSLQENSTSGLTTPLDTMMKLGEATWIGMIGTYQNLWSMIQDQFVEEKP